MKEFQQDNGQQQMLTPWYAINDDPIKYAPFSARESGADGKAHTKAYHRRKELQYQASLTKDQKRSIVQQSQKGLLISVTQAVRKVLNEQQPFALTEDHIVRWFRQQQAAGLKDVFYYCDNWSSGPLQPGDKQGIVCWYENGDKRYTTLDIDDDDKTILVEKKLADTGYVKPRMKNNSEQLVRVLMQLDQASGGYWGDYFLKAAQKAKAGDLLEAVKLSETGAGMGSWYDTPFFEQTKELSRRLSEERHYALLYAVNYC